MHQVRIKRDFGELVIEYSDLQDLESKLNELEATDQLVLSKVGGSLTHHAGRDSKPGYEDVYRFLPNGTVELLLHPTKNVQRVGLVLFAYDQAVPVSAIEQCTNIQNVAANVLSPGPNKKYFVRPSDGNYALSPQGLAWVTSTVIPKLRKERDKNKPVE